MSSLDSLLSQLQGFVDAGNVEEGKKILNESDVNVVAADDLDDAAQKIVKAVRG